MVLQYGQDGFDNNWLTLLKHDPVHPLIPFENRISGNRTVFVFTDNNIPQFMVCARIGNKLTHTMKEVLSDDGYRSKFDVTYAIFYSIFRIPNATIRGAGKMAIKEILEICKLKGVNRFFTLSPIPSLRDFFVEIPNESKIRKYLESFDGPVSKFHLSNGAKIQSINFNADSSEVRQNESWGIMVNYDYNFL
jgi:hypothetical protein